MASTWSLRPPEQPHHTPLTGISRHENGKPHGRTCSPHIHTARGRQYAPSIDLRSHAVHQPISYWLPSASPCSRKGLWCRSIHVIPRTPWSSRGQLCALNPRGGTWSCQRPRSAMSKGLPHLCPLYSRLHLPLGLPVPREHVERCSNPIKQVCFHRGARTSLLLSGTSRRSPYQFRGTGTSAPFSQIRCIYRPDAIEIRMLNGA